MSILKEHSNDSPTQEQHMNEDYVEKDLRHEEAIIKSRLFKYHLHNPI